MSLSINTLQVLPISLGVKVRVLTVANMVLWDLIFCYLPELISDCSLFLARFAPAALGSPRPL